MRSSQAEQFIINIKKNRGDFTISCLGPQLVAHGYSIKRAMEILGALLQKHLKESSNV